MNDKDRMIIPEFEFCLDAIAVCSKIVRDKIFQKYFPNCTYFVASPCPFHLQQPGQSEDFPLCVKTKQHNRLLDVTLNALINVSMNGPNHLDDESAMEVDQNWITAKNRRKVTKRALKTMMSADDIQETDAFAERRSYVMKLKLTNLCCDFVNAPVCTV